MAILTVYNLRLCLMRWPIVLLCCLLSVTAPFSVTTMVQVIDGSPDWVQVGPIYCEVENPLDEEENLIHLGLTDARRAERKQSRPLWLSLPSSQGRPSCWLIDRALLPTPCHCRPGSEHAFRNGCGSPLLC